MSNYSEALAPVGAIKMPTRDQLEKKPYRFQPYPSTRFHPDGRVATVANEAEALALKAPWRDRPYPALPVVAPPPPATVEQHAATIVEHEKTITELKAENEDLRECVREQTEEIQRLQTAALSVQISTPAPAAAAAPPTPKKSK